VARVHEETVYKPIGVDDHATQAMPVPASKPEPEIEIVAPLRPTEGFKAIRG